MTTIKPTILDRARAYVAEIPGAVSGQGGHNQTFAVACALINGFALSEADALAVLLEYNNRCQPAWSDRELQHKITSAISARHDKARGHLLGSGYHPTAALRPARPPEKPKARLDPVTAVEIFLKGFRCGEADLWEASPIRPPEDGALDGIVLLECLYKPGELVNYVTAYTTDKDGKAKPMGTGITTERDALLAKWRSAGMPKSEAGGWLRMNPLDGRGVKDGNVTAHRFALLECDKIPPELQLALFARLPLPTAAIMTSGGRSYHAWIKIDAIDANDYGATVSRLLSLLASFDVDGKNKNPSRLSRLPGVVRTIGAAGDGRQRLVYLNPNPVQKAILCPVI